LGEVIGGYGYKNPEGQDITIEFKASKDVGFQPKGSHLNKIPKLPGITQEEAIANDEYYDDSPDRLLIETENQTLRGLKKKVAFTYRSYKFDFDGDEFSRDESSDSQGKISGSYRFIDSEGQV